MPHIWFCWRLNSIHYFYTSGYSEPFSFWPHDLHHFFQVWQRQSNTYSFLWNTYKNSIANEERKEFYGVPSIDPVTHNSMTYYPSWKRRLRYILSLAIILPFLCLGVVIMTLSLNLNGYVKDTKSFIYVETLAKYAKPVSS